MSKTQRRTDFPRAVHRVGEGALIEVLPRSVVKTDGTTLAVIGVNLGQAPVPDRRYVADVGTVTYANETVKMMFGQQKISSDSLRSLLVIYMSPLATRQFVESVDRMQNPSIEDIAKKLGLQREELNRIEHEPDQTVAFASNMIASAFSGRECCLDFYHASSFSMATAATSKKLAVDPVVRVDIRTSLAIALVEEMRKLEQNFPPEETGGKHL
ncbi:MAG: hypothetical protein HY525_07135 [Betaproteobacteria bacterium]|nr:hypothetical protein [Betaproteobacteria bacterium]